MMKKSILLTLFVLLLVPFLTAQTAQQAPAQAAAPQSTPDQGKKQSQAPQPGVPAAGGHKITPEEAKELFQSADQILNFASRDTLLPMKRPVKKNMVSREQVEKYLEDKFKDDVDRIRFERSELVLKKFGLLPRTFNLHDFLIKLLGEQVAGYYDDKEKTMNLLNWVPMDMQKPVMAHELTHALQDQNFDLEAMEKRDEEIERRGPADYNAAIETDEESTARSAVMEGEAMVVLADYMINTIQDNTCAKDPACEIPDKRSIADIPQFLDLMLAQMDKPEGEPLMDNAPLILREEMVFPYTQGLRFIVKLLTAGGKNLAYTQVEKRMPKTVREILEPEEYLAGRVVPPLLLPDFKFLNADYEPFDAGAVGQFDVNVLLRQYGQTKNAADRLSSEWRGGSYYAVRRKGAKTADPNSSADVGLIYVSKWSNEQTAREFAGIYAASLPQRYENVKQAAGEASGRETFTTSDGTVYIQQSGPLVIAVESLDEKTAKKVIEAVLAQQGKVQ